MERERERIENINRLYITLQVYYEFTLYQEYNNDVLFYYNLIYSIL